MKLSDLARFALQSLFQQKLRTLLNIIGVLIAAFILVFTFAAGEGINRTVTRIFEAEDYLRTIIVSPQYGFQELENSDERIQFADGVSDQKKDRLRKRIVADWQEQSGSWIYHPLKMKDIESIEALEHVESVMPEVYSQCVTQFGEHERSCTFQALDPSDKNLHDRVVAGSLPERSSADEVVISEYLAYLWGFRTDEEVGNLVGKTIYVKYRIQNSNLDFMAQYAANSLRNQATGNSADEGAIDIEAISQRAISFDETTELIKQLRQIPEILEANGVDQETVKLIEAMVLGNPSDSSESEAGDGDEGQGTDSEPKAEEIVIPFRVAAILRTANPDEEESRFSMSFFNGDVDVWLPLDQAIETMRQFSHVETEGFMSAKVVVTHEDHLEETTEKITEMELNQNSLLGFLKFFQGQIAIGKFAMAAIAAVVFFVSGIGITNTMIMSVMERRFEIGVMKAVGAHNRQIVLLFLSEGAMVGLLGSGIAIGLSFLSAWLLDDMAQKRLEGRMGLEIEESIFVFSPSLLATVVGFSTLVTLLATVFPAWRAASVDPIVSLRNR